jgi:plastocyanin
MKHTSTLYGQNVELLIVEQGGTYSYHCAIQDQLKMKLKLKTT